MEKSMNDLHIEYDMLLGCVNRIFVSDDLEEVAKLYYSANTRLARIFRENIERLEKTAVPDGETFINPLPNGNELPFG